MNRRSVLKHLAMTIATMSASRKAHIGGGRSSERSETQRWRRVKQISLTPSASGWDPMISAPHLVQMGDTLRMYFDGWQPQSDGQYLRRIGLAEASVSDPLTFQKRFDSPVLDLGPKGGIDSHWASYPWILPITDRHWHLYYAGWGGEFYPHLTARKKWYTTLAESEDGGLTWKRAGRPLIELGRPGSCDEHGSGSCSVLKVGDEFWMWYTAVSYPRDDWYRISVALAVSKDGGHTFRPHPAGALLNIPPLVGMPGSTSSKPFVEFLNGHFRMWYSCAKDGQKYRIHYAESEDGIHFKWLSDPVLDVSSSGWDREMTCYPSVLHLKEGTFLYYSGDRYTGIGAAQLMS
jgi:hypothetical protein